MSSEWVVCVIYQQRFTKHHTLLLFNTFVICALGLLPTSLLCTLSRCSTFTWLFIDPLNHLSDGRVLQGTCRAFCHVISGVVLVWGVLDLNGEGCRLLPLGLLNW
jgi:hypothetical protein